MPTPEAKVTPLMQQYWGVKAQYSSEIVLFRMGDFYEMFHSDAETAAPLLGIALTQRNKKDPESPKMCGVPYHSIAGQIAKLLKAGLKVAMCDQIEDPALAQGLVKRAVTRVLTPGMVYDPDTLDQISSNYLAAYDDLQLACADIATGEAVIYELRDEEDREELIALLNPVELVLNEPQAQKRRARKCTRLVSIAKTETSIVATERLRQYVEAMQGASVLGALPQFEVRPRGHNLKISSTSYRHLEIFENSRGGREGTLFAAIDRTRTSAGARLMKAWLLSPLTNTGEILRRQNEIRSWIESGPALKEFRAEVTAVGDLERRLGKAFNVNFNASDLRAIGTSLLAAAELATIHPAQAAIEHLAEAAQLGARIVDTLNEDLPNGIKDGGLIRRGVLTELDELIDLSENAQGSLVELETRERNSSGISSLKIRYNNVFGYYVELTKLHAHKAPAHFRRKQTLVNAERFTTDELDELEVKILGARERRAELEGELFARLRADVRSHAVSLLSLARTIGRWDALSGLAWLAIERDYRAPTFHDRGDLNIELGRHPVIEQILKSGFAANSLTLRAGEGLLLTGPNMAGKSTLMRQVALIALLAQMGSFVPAKRADLPVFDAIYTRIGANDQLDEGLSTFMVEMSESAEILRRVGPRSLVLMDEIGRGTSTFDGLSLAQSILEHLIGTARPYLFFATHYHELTGLSGLYPQLKNAHMAIREKNGEIQFLHLLKDGPANRSYGIHVAKLAGLPRSVTERARALLNNFEAAPAHQQLSLTDGTGGWSLASVNKST